MSRIYIAKKVLKEEKKMNNIAEIFKKKLNQYGIKKQVDAALVCEAFDNAILEVFGEAGQKNVKAISYKNNVLKVGVTSSAWAQEVSLKQIELLNGEKIKMVYKTGELLEAKER